MIPNLSLWLVRATISSVIDQSPNNDFFFFPSRCQTPFKLKNVREMAQKKLSRCFIGLDEFHLDNAATLGTKSFSQVLIFYYAFAGDVELHTLIQLSTDLNPRVYLLENKGS